MMTYDTWKATDTADLADEYRHSEDDEPLEEYLVDEWWDDEKWQLLP